MCEIKLEKNIWKYIKYLKIKKNIVKGKIRPVIHFY